MIPDYISRKIRAVRALWFRKHYVVLDGRANSVTVSRRLYRHMMQPERTRTDIIVFRSGDTGLYGFALKEEFVSLLDVPCQTSPLQYNERYRKIGFRTDQPSVTAICTAYGCPVDRMVRLSVIPRHTAQGETFYEIQRPQHQKT